VRTSAVIAEHQGAVRSFAAGAGGKTVVLSDCRQLAVLDDEASAAMGALLQRDNPLIERGAILLGSATAYLQFARLMREAGNPNRQGFRGAATSGWTPLERRAER
jgi:hypothetical protein